MHDMQTLNLIDKRVHRPLEFDIVFNFAHTKNECLFKNNIEKNDNDILSIFKQHFMIIVEHNCFALCMK